MNSVRQYLRHTVLLPSILLITLPAIAQVTDAPPAGTPLIQVGMDTNYILLLIAVVQTIMVITLGSVIKAMGGPGSILVAHFKRIAQMRATGAAMAVFFLSLPAFANAASAAGQVSPDTIFWLLATTDVVLFFILAAQLIMLHGVVKAVAPATDIDVVAVQSNSFAQDLLKRLTKTVKVEHEKEIELHHEYDGIKELDNQLPPWWLWLFYGTIAWAVLYMVNVHVLDIWPKQIQEYEQEMAQAKADVEAYLANNAAAVDENTAAIDPSMIANGKAIFDMNCKACHGVAGEGTVGPNLTDDHWKNGGGIKNIFKTVKYGVPERGMIAWKAQLSPIEIHAVANYIISLHGTNPPNAKPAEGELWIEDAAQGTTTEAVTAGL